MYEEGYAEVGDIGIEETPNGCILTQETKFRLHIVHIASKEEAEAVIESLQRMVAAWTEKGYA